MSKIRLNRGISVDGVAKATRDDYFSRHQAQPGDFVPGEGIYLGQWEPKWRNGKSLGKIFNVYAAPCDMISPYSDKAELFHYTLAVKLLNKSMQGWFGHKGVGFIDDKELLRSLNSGRYHGEWMIPPRELLDGHDFRNRKMQADNLYDHRDKGALKGTFNTSARTGGGYDPSCYMSCTEGQNWRYLWTKNFRTGMAIDYLSSAHLRVRPVRLVPV